MLHKIASGKNIVDIIGSEWVNKQFQDFAYHSERLFQSELSA